MSIRDAISHLADGRDLSEAEMEAVVLQVMAGEATAAQLGGLLVGLRMKGERVEEITGAARAMRQHATRVATRREVVDTCGTGGDMKGTFNISTAAAFIATAAGVVVAKHGNRAMSGAVGGADVLEELGVRIDLDAARVASCLDEVGMAFLFAPVFHPAMRHVAPARRELGIRTIFNLLGPLSNPAGATAQLVGVFSGEWVEPMAHALGRLGSRRALVVHGEDGLDEISTGAPTLVAELREGTVRTFRMTPGEFGLPRSRPEDLQGGDVRQNAQLVRDVLSGTAPPACLNIALLNAGAAIYVGGMADSVADGLVRARQAVDSGRACEVLRQLIDFGNR